MIPGALLIWPICQTGDHIPPGNTGLSATPETDPSTLTILNRIREREAHIYRTYTGVASLRHSHIRVYRGSAKNDPAAMLNDVRLSADRQDFYDTMPAVEITRFIKDGERMPNSDFEYNEFMPPYPLFGADSQAQYALQLHPAPVLIEGVPCYQVTVQPRRRTKRHFIGTLFFRTDSLDLLYIRGSFAKLQIGLSDFFFEFYFTAGPDGVPLFTKGYAEGRIYFPLLRDETIVSDMTMENARPIRR